MSALPRTADMFSVGIDVRYVPIGDIRQSRITTVIPRIAMPVEEPSTASKADIGRPEV